MGPAFSRAIVAVELLRHLLIGAGRPAVRDIWENTPIEGKA